ncbi:MAG: MSMEG_0565 family glycosyltransferase [Sporichthyaceae bacterium]
MKIALLTYSTRPRGGVVHTLALAEALLATGCQVDVWALARGGDDAFYRAVDHRLGVHLIPVADREGEDFGARVARSIAALRAAFSVRRDSYDVVHAQDCITANAAGPCVRTVHHLDVFTTAELAACHEQAITRPYAHVCVSTAVAAELHAGWGITARVIPNGVDSARFARAAGDDADLVSARRGWQRRFGTYVLSVGGIEPRKGSLELLEAMAALRARGNAEVPLVIAGGTTLFDYRDYRARWHQRADELGLHPQVLGPVDDADLPSLVAGAAAFAFPSTKEGFGLAAMEALAAGVPVVAADLPVLREVFTGAVEFAATPPEFAAALTRALAGPDPARAQRGRDLAAGYTWTNAARAHLKLYQHLNSSQAGMLEACS